MLSLLQVVRRLIKYFALGEHCTLKKNLLSLCGELDRSIALALKSRRCWVISGVCRAPGLRVHFESDLLLGGNIGHA